MKTLAQYADFLESVSIESTIVMPDRVTVVYHERVPMGCRGGIGRVTFWMRGWVDVSNILKNRREERSMEFKRQQREKADEYNDYSPTYGFEELDN